VKRRNEAYLVQLLEELRLQLGNLILDSLDRFAWCDSALMTDDDGCISHETTFVNVSRSDFPSERVFVILYDCLVVVLITTGYQRQSLPGPARSGFGS
jgi:hypothetical protein